MWQTVLRGVVRWAVGVLLKAAAKEVKKRVEEHQDEGAK